MQSIVNYVEKSKSLAWNQFFCQMWTDCFLLQTAVYDKSLRLASYTLSGGSMTQGQITNHMSVDATNVLEVFQYICYIIIVPYVVSLHHMFVQVLNFLFLQRWPIKEVLRLIFFYYFQNYYIVIQFIWDKFWMNKEKFTRAGFESATSGLTCRRSTNWAN